LSGPRAIFSLAFLAAAIWLANGLAGHSLGDIDAFLPPAEVASAAQSQIVSASSESPWVLNDLQTGLAQAKSEGKPVFIDFTGYTCTNCRWMEQNIFSKPTIKSDMNRFVKVRLYTDGDGEVYTKQQDYEDNTFGTVALPLYALLDSNGKLIDTSAGVTRDVSVFASFLSKAQ
jgi:thiol:disulfide interchange protein DsbD